MPKFDKKAFVLSTVGILFVCILFFGVFFFVLKNKLKENINNSSQSKVQESTEQKAENNSQNPGLQPRKLDGVLAVKEEANKYPIAVMIDNLSSVRPQAGLSKASIVYETLVESGVTRFLALFSGEKSDQIGPVRSIRPYYLEWSSEYDALVSHCGGSPEALQMISAFNIKDLNQMWAGGAPYFWRDKKGIAPHNLYTSTTLLERALRDKNLLEINSNFESWQFKDDLEVSQRSENVNSVKINFSGYNYLVEYKYNKESNSYLRFNGGKPHTDKISGEQIKIKNVIIEIIPQILSIGAKGRITLDVTGEGKAIMCNDGQCKEGKWKKENREGRTKFYLDENKEFEFNRGNVWVEIVPKGREVSY